MIVLAWPARELHPNYRSRTHMGKARATKAARLNAAWATIAAQVQAPAEGDIPLTVTLYPPSRRSDRQNNEAACKALLDGIADGLKVNDRAFRITWQHGEPVKGGRVEVAL